MESASKRACQRLGVAGSMLVVVSFHGCDPFEKVEAPRVCALKMPQDGPRGEWIAAKAFVAGCVLLPKGRPRRRNIVHQRSADALAIDRGTDGCSGFVEHAVLLS